MAIAKGAANTILSENDIVTNANVGTGSIEFWFYNGGAPVARKYLVGIEGWIAVTFETTNKVAGFCDGNGGTTALSGTIPANDWSFIEYNWAGTDASAIYLNGTQSAGTKGGALPNPESTASRKIGYGNNYDGGGGIAGSIGPLRISNSRRNTSAYVAPAKGTLSDDANALLIWNLVDMTGTVASDAAGNSKVGNINGGTWVDGGFGETTASTRYMNLNTRFW